MSLRGQGRGFAANDRGYAMAALLVGLSVMAVLMGMALPVWSTMMKREREEELIWRGQQYARAVGLFQRKYANTFPPSVDVLVEQKFLRKKYKDPITNDDFQLIPAGQAGPGGIQLGTAGGAMTAGATTMTVQQGQMADGRGGFSARGTMQGPTPAPQPGQRGGQLAGGFAGVVSKSTDTALKVYNGRTKYNEWAFTYIQRVQAPGVPGAPGGRGAQQPGAVGQPGVFGAPGAPGQQQPGGFGPGGRGFGPGGRGPFGPGNPNRPPVPNQFGAPNNPFQPPQPNQQNPFQPNPFQPQQPQPKRPPL